MKTFYINSLTEGYVNINNELFDKIIDTYFDVKDLKFPIKPRKYDELVNTMIGELLNNIDYDLKENDGEISSVIISYVNNETKIRDYMEFMLDVKKVEHIYLISIKELKRFAEIA